ncbi:MAG: PilT/PilU family type 4a pilus ATPase [Comamonadaceae bacterium]|nr:MAG: PilT/PilU family type 4a pilus ATPase [Comamonadaceae bacterium]
MKTMERILRLMAERKASDVYFSAHAPAQMRINGQCVPINAQILPADAPRNLLAEVVSEARMDELEQTGELNMAIPLEGVGNFRISAMRQRGTYAVVVRYVASVIPGFDDLNLPDVLKTLVMEKRGLILMVGATGAGKTTTLASMLDYRNANASGHILTVEEPIEFVYTNKKSLVNQRDVGSDTQSLHIALKNALRQAPDVIQIGEIRDRETMTAAITYAQSGHLCLATLHANNAYRALNRILSFYPVEVRPTLLGDLGASLRAVVAQRLLRTPLGGRMPALEIMLNTSLVAELIEKGDFSSVKEAMEQSMAEGSQTFEEDIARLILSNKVERDEGLAQADSPTNLLWRLQNHNKPAAVVEERALMDQAEEPTFTEITLDVRY